MPTFFFTETNTKFKNSKMLNTSKVEFNEFSTVKRIDDIK